MQNKVRTRFAPSPTGFVHIGSIQKIIFSYAYAKANGGDYILRIEDTDQGRYVEGAEDAIYQAHEDLGIKVDESPKHGGKFAPYRQSERLELYREYAERLIEADKAYYAFETSEELAAMRKAQQENGERPHYNGKSRDLSTTEARVRIANGENYVVRMKVPSGQTLILHDGIMGEIKINTSDLDDYVLLKSDGYPTYHLAVVVDDHLMEISHVFRGVEWLATFPIHLLLYRYFEWEAPHFFHVPNILDPKGGKLSKRNGSVALEEFYADGYLNDAIINFMILLGWAPKSNRELFTLEEFVSIFKLENLNKSNPVFNREKLNWFNEQYIRKLSPDAFVDVFIKWLKKYHSNHDLYETLIEMNKKKLGAILTLEQERITILKDLFDKIPVFLEVPSEFELGHKFLKGLTNEQKQTIIDHYIEILKKQEVEGKSFANHEQWEAAVREIVTATDLKPREVFMTIRIALTGKSATPPLYEFGEIVGLESQLARLEKAKENLV